MWVKLKTVKQIPIQGVPTTYHPGDWVNVGKHVAKLWLAQGDAEIPDPEVQARLVSMTAGIAICGNLTETQQAQIAQFLPHMETRQCDGYELPFTETLIWNPSAPLRYELISAGFGLLDRWQIAVPIMDYTTLAADIGTEEDRAHTAEVIRDLRVPLRDPRLMFVARCDDTQRLMETWRAECEGGGDERLAFMRALYIVKPITCDLPASWLEGRGK